MDRKRQKRRWRLGSPTLGGARGPRWSLVLAFLAITVSFIAATVYSQYTAKAIDVAATQIAGNASPSIQHLAAARSDLHEVEVTLREQIRVAEGGGRPNLAAIQQARIRFDGMIEQYLALRSFPGEPDLWRSVDDRLRAFNRAVSLTVLELRDGQPLDARSAYTEAVVPAFENLSEALLHSIEFNAERASMLAIQIERTREQAMMIAVVLDGAAVIAAIFAAMVVSRVIRSYEDVVQSHSRLLSRQADELEMFAARVAHDILSPLGTAGLALDVCAIDRVPAETREKILGQGRAALLRTKQIVDDLLAFARAAEPDPNAKAEVDVVVGEVVHELEIEALATATKLETEALPRRSVACSPGVLSSLIGNLVRNALKHMGDRPHREVKIRAEDRENRVRVEVADTGPGIPEDALDVIFLPHVRHTAADRGGLGLGLATVKRLAEAHGGAVGVKSRVGQGSTFWFELPVTA